MLLGGGKVVQANLRRGASVEEALIRGMWGNDRCVDWL